MCSAHMESLPIAEMASRPTSELDCLQESSLFFFFVWAGVLKVSSLLWCNNFMYPFVLLFSKHRFGLILEDKRVGCPLQIDQACDVIQLDYTTSVCGD
jgi:hypothetical protein